jgi:hypothetical protein
MPRIIINKRIKLAIDAPTMELFKNFYTDLQFDLIKDIFCTYYNRGGVLRFVPFAMIPITKNAGSIKLERGAWTKYIRGKLANGWDDLTKHCT